MKTFDKKDIFTCVTADEAITYIGNNGYFANSLSGFNHIDCFAPYSLDEVQIGTDKPFVYKKESYALFLPADKVKEVEEPKKWRPFNCIEEVFVTLNKDVGSFITYRTKDFPLRTITTTITGYTKEKNKEDQIQIGAGMIELSNCFEGIEIWNGKDWQPFGVEE